MIQKSAFIVRRKEGVKVKARKHHPVRKKENQERVVSLKVSPA